MKHQRRRRCIYSFFAVAILLNLANLLIISNGVHQGASHTSSSTERLLRPLDSVILRNGTHLVSTAAETPRTRTTHQTTVNVSQEGGGNQRVRINSHEGSTIVPVDIRAASTIAIDSSSQANAPKHTDVSSELLQQPTRVGGGEVKEPEPSVTATNKRTLEDIINPKIEANAPSYWEDRDPLPVNRSAVRDFERQDRVVIVTKVHGDQAYQIADVKQSMCLLHAAYNNRVHYDIVVFTTDPWNATDVQELAAIVAPAHIQIVIDSPPVADVVRAMSASGRQKLIGRCSNVSTAADFHWHVDCDDGKLRYNWQAEFRTRHIWTHPALEPYKYMLWIDSDGHAGAKWHQDPVATMIRNDLVLLFDNFPAGLTIDPEVRRRIYRAFDTTDHCGIGLRNGHFVTFPHQTKSCFLLQVHGFFHVTNLDFYRSQLVQHWFNTLIGDDHYRRLFDDQIGVTVPAAILAPTQSWDMYAHNITLKVVHNRFFDGKKTQVARGYMKYWDARAEHEFPEAFGTCDPYIKSQG